MSANTYTSLEKILKGKPQEIAASILGLIIEHPSKSKKPYYKGVALNSDRDYETVKWMLEFTYESSDQHGRLFGGMIVLDTAAALLKALEKISRGERINHIDKDALANHRIAFQGYMHLIKTRIERYQEPQGPIQDPESFRRSMPLTAKDPILSALFESDRKKAKKDKVNFNDQTKSYFSDAVFTDQNTLYQITNHAIPLCDGLCRKLGIQVNPTLPDFQ